MGGNSKGKQEDQAVERLQLRGQTGAGSVEAFARGGVRAALLRRDDGIPDEAGMPHGDTEAELDAGRLLPLLRDYEQLTKPERFSIPGDEEPIQVAEPAESKEKL